MLLWTCQAIRVCARAGVQVLQDEQLVLGDLQLVQFVLLQLAKQMAMVEEGALHQLA